MNYKELDAPEFLSAVGTDASKWAEAFMQINGARLADIDESTMIGWFANAIMAMHDKLQGNPILNGDHAQYLIDRNQP